MGLLVFLQLAVSWSTAHRPSLRRLITAEPAVLLSDGELRREVMKRERVVESEVLQAVRHKGGRGLSDADVVILQSDGSMAVILSS